MSSFTDICMTIEADRLIHEVIDQFPEYEDLLQWVKVRINYRMRSCAGRAFHLYRRIDLNPNLLSAKSDQFRGTLLHELAHLLVGPGHGHDRAWKVMCLKLGGTGERCHTMDCSNLRRKRAKVPARCERCGSEIPLTEYRCRQIARGGRVRHTGCGGLVIPEV